MNEVNQQEAKPKKSKSKKIRFQANKGGARKNLVLMLGAVLTVVALSIAIFFTLSSLFSTEQYYVLNTNVRARQAITPDMVIARETSAGTGPINAISMEDLQRGGVYSRYPLYAGDVVAYSNAGTLSNRTVGIPDDWVVTSFSIDSTNAAGGTIGKGDYVDLLGVGSQTEEGAKYIFNNLMVLDVKFVNEEIEDNSDGRTLIGEAMHYTVGMPSEQVAYLHEALRFYDQIKLIKAPLSLEYENRDIKHLDRPFVYDMGIENFDLFEGTDPTFTDIERDESGRPLINKDNQKENSDGITLTEEQIDDFTTRSEDVVESEEDLSDIN